MRTKTNKSAAKKPSVWFYLAWAAPSIAVGVVSVLLGYVTYYSTNYLGLPPMLVGTLMLVSKLFDGVTDLVAGFVIDRTNTRFGRARPYDLVYPLFCIFAVLFFAIPTTGQVATAMLVFIVYNLIFSVFQTLYSCANAVFLARAVEDDTARVSVGAITGLIISVLSMAAAVVLPPLVATMGTTREGWIRLALLICVPSAALALVRFFTIKETASTALHTAGKINIKEGVRLLLQNNYVLVFALVLLLTNISTNMSQVNPYYYQYIAGDMALQSIFGIGMMIGPVTLLFFPALSKKIGLKRLFQAAFVLGIAGRLLPLLGPGSIPLLLAGSVLNGIACMPIFVLSSNIIINCMDYGEWKSGKRGEGIYACVIGFCSKLGIGVASALIGFATALGGFDGKAAVQAPAANTAILLLYTVIPACLFLAAMLAMHFYKLDGLLPTIQKELAQRRSAVTE